MEKEEYESKMWILLLEEQRLKNKLLTIKIDKKEREIVGYCI